MRMMLGLAVVVLVLGAPCAWADAPAGAGEYLDGLAALQQAKFADAADLLAKAVDADGENPDYHIAHAVALIFSEKPADAQHDLELAQRLRQGDKTARLWMATSVAMLGDFRRDSEIYPVATRDVYETAVRKMSRDYGAYAFAQQMAARENGTASPNGPEMQKMAAARASFPKLAEEFAAAAESALSETNPDIAALLRERGIKKVESKDFAGGISDLNKQLASNPTDPALLSAHAAAALALGAPMLARTECTIALTYDVNAVDAYVTRATAAARVGDVRRAAADLATAAILRPGTADKDKGAVDAAAEETPAGFKAEELQQRIEELHKMAADNAPWDALVTEAISIIKGENNARRMFDEDYQDGLRQCVWAVNQEPQSAQRLAELGEYIYRGALGIRGEVVEPRAQFHSYRYIGPNGQQDEVAQAAQYLDSALKIDPQNVRAMEAKAGTLIFQGQWDDAQQLLQQALSIKSDDPQLLRMLANVLDHLAGVKADQAAGDRAIKTWEDAIYIYTRYPSPAELQEAKELDAEAQRLWELASQSLQKAAQLRAGTAEGFYFASVISRRSGDADAAMTNLQQAVKLAPDNVEYHDALADLYNERGMRDATADERTVAVNLVQTTAGPMLRVAWQQIGMAQFKTAKGFLSRAMALDPADARSEAYMGAIALQEENAGDALAWMRAAAAMDEAKARFEGRSSTATAMGVMPPEKMGFGINVDLKIAQLLLKSKRYDEAMAMLELAAAAGNRVPRDQWYEQVPASMLPGDNPDPSTIVPVAYSTADLMAYTHLDMGDALMATGKEKAARSQYSFVLRCQSDAPPVVDVGSRIRLPVCLAAMALGRNYLRHHDARDAFDVLNGHVVSYSEDQKELWTQYNALMDQARRETER